MFFLLYAQQITINTKIHCNNETHAFNNCANKKSQSTQYTVFSQVRISDVPGTAKDRPLWCYCHLSASYYVDSDFAKFHPPASNTGKFFPKARHLIIASL